MSLIISMAAFALATSITPGPVNVVALSSGARFGFVASQKHVVGAAVGQRSYLATIARGLCIDLWRRRQLEKAWLDSLALCPQATQPSPEQRAIIVETLYEVDAMLARLPKNVREAFLLAQLHGLAYKQIAEQLGVGERMVKKYMAQALLHCAILEAELDGMLVQ